MDLYDIFLIVLIVLIFVPQAIARKFLEKSGRTRPEITLPEFEDDEELSEELEDMEQEESSPVPQPAVLAPVADPVAEPAIVPAVPMPKPASVPAPVSVQPSPAAPAKVVPRILAAERPASPEETGKFTVDPKEMILYSAIMEPKFKDI